MKWSNTLLAQNLALGDIYNYVDNVTGNFSRWSLIEPIDRTCLGYGMKNGSERSGGDEPIGLRVCRGLADIPMYIINTDDKPGRLKYSREVWGDKFTRIRGVNGSDFGELNGVFHIFDGMADAPASWAEEWHDKTRTTAGESACLASHLKALKTLYDDGHEYGIIMEDDVGLQLCPLWPFPITRLITQAQRADPHWELLRMQWYVPDTRMYKMMEEHIAKVKLLFEPDSVCVGQADAESGVARKCSDSATSFSQMQINLLRQQWSDWPDSIPFIAPCEEPLWGAGANIWSRRAVEKILNRLARTDELAGWECGGQKCHIEDAILQETIDHCFAATPGFLSPRFVEEGSAIRGDGQAKKYQHRRAHFASTLFHMRWLANFLEVFTSLSFEYLPVTDMWVSVGHPEHR